MGKKDPPAPVVPMAKPVTEAVDRDELNKETVKKIDENKDVMVAKNNEGKADPKLGLLQDRKRWEEIESSSLLSRKT